MKKNLLLILAILYSSLTFAQTMDSVLDGKHYYIVSPNGRYFTGTVDEGPAVFYDMKVKEHRMSDIDSVSILAITDEGIACGSYNGQAAIWLQGGDWKFLPPVTVSGRESKGGEICGMSYDATKFVALITLPSGNKAPIYYELEGGINNWDNKSAWSVSNLPTPNRENLLYNQNPQFIQICGMDYNATRILGRYKLYDGKRDVPFIWQKVENGTWNIKFVAERCLFIEDVLNGAIQLPNETERGTTDPEIQEYDDLRRSVETGIVFDMSPYSMFAWSGNGKYIPIVAKVNGEDASNYAAVVDIENDTIIVFTALENAGTVSVNDKGEVMIYTPSLSQTRNSFVASINTPDKVVSLLEYTKERSNGKIDLAENMTYQVGTDLNEDFEEVPLYEVLTGSAVWSNYGNAFVTFQYDPYSVATIPECYMVCFDEIVAVENVKFEQLLVYPNPTQGCVYFEKQLENVVVYDISGRKVYEQTGAEQMLDLSCLNAGTYIVKAVCENRNITAKVVIAR
ncbi:MAG: T9SS type A sorting domain-containing protein [Paludibacteraceae bacterium]|nr:T9SS type A sorting domain-containing protein [Paludibacteraceae bacterium]